MLQDLMQLSICFRRICMRYYPAVIFSCSGSHCTALTEGWKGDGVWVAWCMYFIRVARGFWGLMKVMQSCHRRRSVRHTNNTIFDFNFWSMPFLVSPVPDHTPKPAAGLDGLMFLMSAIFEVNLVRVILF